MCPEHWNSICYSFNSAFLLHTGTTERTMRQCFQVQSELLTVFQRLWHLEYSFRIFSWCIELCCLIQRETTLCSKTFPKSFLSQVAASAVFSCAVSSPSGPVGYRLNRESHEHTVALSPKKFNITKIYTAFKILLCISDMVLNFLVSREAFNHTLNSWDFQNSDCFPCCNIIFLLADDWDF